MLWKSRLGAEHDHDEREFGILHLDLDLLRVVLHAGQHRLQDAAGAEDEFVAGVIDIDVVVERFFCLEAGKLGRQLRRDLLFAERSKGPLRAREPAGRAGNEPAIRQEDHGPIANSQVDAADGGFAILVVGCDCFSIARLNRAGGQIDAVLLGIDGLGKDAALREGDCGGKEQGAAHEIARAHGETGGR